MENGDDDINFKSLFVPFTAATLVYLSVLFGLVIFITFSLFTFLKDPPVWPDEAIFFDTYTNITRSGNMATNLFKDSIAGMQIKALWYPPLYFYLMSFWTSLFGQSIEVARCFSLLLSVSVLGIFFWVIDILFKSRKFAFTGFFLLLIDSAFNTAAKVGRMDMLSFFFLVSGILLYLFARERKKMVYFILVGVVLGLGILTHPFGLTTTMLIVIFVAIEKESLKSKITSLAYIFAPVFISIFIWYLATAKYFSIFVTQFQLQLTRKALEVPYVISLFQTNICWQLLMITYALIAISLAYMNYKYPSWLGRFCLIGLIVSVIALVWGRESWYLLYFQPFITLSVLTLFKLSKSKKNIFFLTSAVFLTIVVLIINLIFIFGKLNSLRNTDYNKYAGKVSEAIPSGSTVFLASIPDPYFSLIRKRGITLIEFPTVPVTDRSYKRLLDSADYIIVNYVSDKRLFDYINKNTEKKFTVIQGGYKTDVIKLRKVRNGI